MDDNSVESIITIFTFYHVFCLLALCRKSRLFQLVHRENYSFWTISYNAKMQRFCWRLPYKIYTFLQRNNCPSCRRVTFAQTRNRIARIMLVVEHKKLTISGLFVFWICWSIRIQDPTKILDCLRDTQNEVFSWCILWNNHDFRQSAHRHRTC